MGDAPRHTNTHKVMRALFDEILIDIDHGQLDERLAGKAFTALLNGQEPFSGAPELLRDNTPRWYMSLEDQIRLVRQLAKKYHWPLERQLSAPIAIPYAMKTQSPTEVLMLNVNLPGRVRRPAAAHTVEALLGPMSTRLPHVDNVRLSRLLEPYDSTFRMQSRLAVPGTLEWVAFDYAAYEGQPLETVRTWAASDGRTLAGTEVMMAMLLFPEWVESLIATPDTVHLQLGGLTYDGRGSSIMPVLRRLANGRRELRFEPLRGSDLPLAPNVSTPTVRRF